MNSIATELRIESGQEPFKQLKEFITFAIVMGIFFQMPVTGYNTSWDNFAEKATKILPVPLNALNL